MRWSTCPQCQLMTATGGLSSEDFSLALADELSRGGPWGQHFPEPTFDGAFSVLRHRIVGEKHLKLTLVKERAEIEAIAFNIDVDAWIEAPPVRDPRPVSSRCQRVPGRPDTAAGDSIFLAIVIGISRQWSWHADTQPIDSRPFAMTRSRSGR
jgi:hypothetical protein